MEYCSKPIQPSMSVTFYDKIQLHPYLFSEEGKFWSTTIAAIIHVDNDPNF